MHRIIVVLALGSSVLGGLALASLTVGGPAIAGGAGGEVGIRSFAAVICKNWYSIPRTLSDEGAHRFAYRDDRSARAFAVKPRASGAPLRGCGA